MRKTLAIITIMLVSTSALAEDRRLPELLHLLAVARACDIEPTAPAMQFINGVAARAGKGAVDKATDGLQAAVNGELAEKGAATVCWDAWEKMRLNGFVKP